MIKQQIGVIGLAVMGRNLALNIAEHGFSVAVYNRSPEKTRELIAETTYDNMSGVYSIAELTESLELPRKIIMMVKAGSAVDETIKQLIPFLSPGDILIDGGNSFFEDTIRRCSEMETLGLKYIGAGISGGEEGARKGPAIMPGGEKSAYELVKPILLAISAKVDNDPCCTYIGPNGAGHFVKMVHNGIEYADMQLICEAYLLMKNVLGLTPPQLHEIFKSWNSGELSSYLIEITADIFTKIDPDTGKYLVDQILDVAGNKGTGKWTSQIALDMGVAIPTITEAVFARFLSTIKDERVRASKIYQGSAVIAKPAEFIESIRKALYASKICSYAQGFSLMKAASEKFGWDLDLGSIAMIFRGGCIIRAQFLNRIKDAYQNNSTMDNLLQDDYFRSILEGYVQDWRDVVIAAVAAGVPVPGFASAISYFDSYRTESLPMNLLQAQRDYFGAHTYQRTDKPGSFHTQW